MRAADTYLPPRLKREVRRILTPLLRAYVRYAPFAVGKRFVWTRIVEPYFANHSHRFVASTVFGTRIVGDTRDFLQRYIYYFGVWEPDLTHWVERRLSPGDAFIDVGANIGYYSLLASTVVGSSGAVVAIEASPTIFGALQTNLTRNRIANVRAVNVAASDRKGMVKVFRGTDQNLGDTTILQDHGLAFECEVDGAPLTAILHPEEMQHVRLMKIDVEGAEWAVVGGIGPLLSSYHRDLEIIIEIHPEQLARQRKRPEDLMRIFLDAGFHAYGLENDYSPLSHMLPRTEMRPVRIRAPLQHECFVIFSRQDVEML